MVVLYFILFEYNSYALLILNLKLIMNELVHARQPKKWHLPTSKLKGDIKVFSKK